MILLPIINLSTMKLKSNIRNFLLLTINW